MPVNNIIKRIQNIMRSDAGINGDAQLNFINNALFPVIKGQDVEYNG
ncbi:MAG: hypothetical protein MJZ56_05000 [Bacteroidales bacterium]|nr:hypothetical protein [Bacteroidales bacterium]